MPWSTKGVDVSISQPPIPAMVSARSSPRRFGCRGAVAGAVRNQVGAVIGSLRLGLIVESVFAGRRG